MTQIGQDHAYGFRPDVHEASVSRVGSELSAPIENWVSAFRAQQWDPRWKSPKRVKELYLKPGGLPLKLSYPCMHWGFPLSVQRTHGHQRDPLAMSKSLWARRAANETSVQVGCRIRSRESQTEVGRLLLVPTLCRADLGWIFYFGPANFRKIAGEFLSEFWWRIFLAKFSALFLSGLQATQKIHALISRPEIVGIPLQFHFLEPEIYSRRFSAYGEGQLLCLCVSQPQTLRAQRLKNFNLDWKFQSRPSEFPTKIGVWWVARLKCSISLEIFKILKIFNLWALRKVSHKRGFHAHPLTAREREHWCLQRLSHFLAANFGRR